MIGDFLFRKNSIQVYFFVLFKSFFAVHNLLFNILVINFYVYPVYCT